MSTDDIGKLLEQIKADIGLTDPAKVQMLARVTADAISLQTRHLAGIDVTAEVAVVQATALNLSEGARNAIANRVLAYSESFLTKLLVSAAAS